MFETETVRLFQDGTVSGETYKRMLRNVLFPKLANYPFHIGLQQREASIHLASEVIQYLDHKLSNKWMKWRGSLSWPFRSPVITSGSFFFWIRMKKQVYLDLLGNITEFRGKRCHAVDRISEETIRKCSKTSKTNFCF